MRTKKEKKVVEEVKKPIGPNSEIVGDNVDASNPVYNNCVFYQIDSAMFGAMMKPQMMQHGISQNVKDEEIEALHKKLVEYVSLKTNFSMEMIERVLEQAEDFMNEQLGGGDLI